jgi:hypothetical protein
MYRFVLMAFFVGIVVIPCSVAQETQQMSAVIEGDQVIVSVEGDLFTAYKFSHDQKYPYFWPVNGPVSGESVTTESSEPFPHHHSLFFGCDKVNRGNYWQEANHRGQILSQGPEIVEAAGERVVFTDTCLWKRPKRDAVIRDTRRVTVSAPGEGVRIIDFEITMEPLKDIEIEKTNHSLFSARMVPELSVNEGGTLINAEGDTAETGTFAKPSPWCDYTGTRDGVTEGLAILQNPGNRWYPSRWFTRDYGFFSPTPMYWLENDRLELSKGETLSLKYRVIVHSGDVNEAGIAQHFAAYAGKAMLK